MAPLWLPISFFLLYLFPSSSSSPTRSVSGLTFPRDVSQEVAIAPPPHIPGSLTAPIPTTSTSVNGTQERKIRIQIKGTQQWISNTCSVRKKTPNVLLNLSIKQKLVSPFSQQSPPPEFICLKKKWREFPFGSHTMMSSSANIQTFSSTADKWNGGLFFERHTAHTRLVINFFHIPTSTKGNHYFRVIFLSFRPESTNILLLLLVRW